MQLQDDQENISDYPTDYIPSSNFRSFDEIPEKFRSIFSSYPCLNAIQSQVLDDIFYTNNSVVVSAPTGSGKTVLFELAIIKLLMTQSSCEYVKDFKIIYIAPVKALCTERYTDWYPKFAQFGLSCVEVTGDTGDYFDLQGYNIILTTPEKWDSMTRKWRDNMSLVQIVKLFLIDEVHLLNDDKRGPILETIVCRMKTVGATLKYSGQENSLRIIAVSATIYNIEDIAVWLGSKENPAHYHKFGNEMRPVKLNRIVKGYTCPQQQNAFLFDLQLTYKLKSLLMEYAQGKPSLIFCSTRKSVIQTSQILAQQVTFHFTELQYHKLHVASCGIVENKIKNLVLAGIGCHHAGMSSNDRNIIQDLFASGYIPILVATSTLAMGVNLPAHLVIIKSTQQFIAGTVTEYRESAILQMIGRAGRPQFDEEATAIIMTKSFMVPKYERMLDSKEIIESSLHHHLTEHLNSEIVLFTITDISVAMEWIRSSFLYVRAQKNPKYYGIDSGANIDNKLQTICLREINALKKCGLIEFNENGMDVSPTIDGRLMSHFYLSFETFKIFLQIKGTENISDILSAISEAHEFSEVQLRINERRMLNDLNRNKNRDCIRYPLPGKIKTRSMKVNCLIQSCLGCLQIQDPSLHQESIHIVKAAERIAKCLSEFLSKKSFFQSLVSAAILAKCLHAKLWDDSPLISRQLDKIGPSLGSLLSACGKTSFQAIEQSNPRDLECILNRPPPLGNILQNAVRHLPKYNLVLDVYEIDVYTASIEVFIHLLNADDLKIENTAGDHHWLSLIIGDSNNTLLAFHRISDKNLVMNEPFKIEFKLKLANLPDSIFAHLISDQWVGLDVKNTLELTPKTIICEPISTTQKQKRKCKKSDNTPVKKLKCPNNDYKTCNISDYLSTFFPQGSNKTDAEKVQECLGKFTIVTTTDMYQLPKSGISQYQTVSKLPVNQMLSNSAPVIYNESKTFSKPIHLRNFGQPELTQKPALSNKIGNSCAKKAVDKSYHCNRNLMEFEEQLPLSIKNINHSDYSHEPSKHGPTSEHHEIDPVQEIKILINSHYPDNLLFNKSFYGGKLEPIKTTNNVEDYNCSESVTQTSKKLTMSLRSPVKEVNMKNSSKTFPGRNVKLNKTNYSFSHNMLLPCYDISKQEKHTEKALGYSQNVSKCLTFHSQNNSENKMRFVKNCITDEEFGTIQQDIPISLYSQNININDDNNVEESHDNSFDVDYFMSQI